MTNSIKLINNNITTSTGLKLLHGALTYGWKNSTSVDPGEGFYGDVEAQFSGWENPTLNLMFHIPVGDATYADGGTWMNWAKWNELVKNQYLSTVDTATSIEIIFAGRARREDILGSFLTGETGTANRKYTLTYTGIDSDSIVVYIDGELQVETTDYTYLSGVITFVDKLADIVEILITYNTSSSFYDYSLSTSSTGTSTPKIQIKGYTLTFNPVESREGYFWTINAQIQITK